MANLDDAIKQCQKYLSTLKGVKQAPTYPPEQMSEYPFVASYAGPGTWEFGPAQDKRGLHSIVTELHVNRKDLPVATQAVMFYVDLVPDILMSKLLYDNKWNGTIDTFQQISYTFGFMEWNGIATLGFRWKIENIKMQSAISTS